MSYRVVIPASVQNVILEHALFIAEDSIEHALQWEAELRDTILSLGEAPKAFRVDETLTARLGHEIRRRPLGNYVIFYHLDHRKQTVVIEHFRHASQDELDTP